MTDSKAEQNFLQAIAFFSEADAGYVDPDFDIDYDVEYEKLNVLITGLRSIIAIEQTSGYAPQVAEMKGRARFILSHIGA